MKRIHMPLKATIFSLTMLLCVGVSADFNEAFNGSTLHPMWTTVGDGHKGLSNGTYQLTDATDKKGTDLYRSIQDVPTSSFETSISASFAPFTLPNTKTAFTWIINGHNGNVSMMYNSFGKLELRHNDFDGQNGSLAVVKDIDSTDGLKLTFTIKYNAETDTLTALYSNKDGTAVEIYSGGGVGGGKFEDFASLRATAKLYKFSNTPADQAVISIDEWSFNATE